MKRLIITAGLLFLLAGILSLLLWLVVPIGINDAEAGHIRDTGLPHNSETLTWTEWMPIEEIHVRPYGLGAREVPTNAVLKETRYGVGRSWFCSFGFYEIRYETPDGIKGELPGLGPNSWTKMNFTAPVAAVSLGVVMIAAGFVMKRKTQPAGGADVSPVTLVLKEK